MIDIFHEEATDVIWWFLVLVWPLVVLVYLLVILVCSFVFPFSVFICLHVLSACIICMSRYYKYRRPRSTICRSFYNLILKHLRFKYGSVRSRVVLFVKKIRSVTKVIECQWCCSVNFEQISHIVLAFPLLPLNK